MLNEYLLTYNALLSYCTAKPGLKANFMKKIGFASVIFYYIFAIAYPVFAQEWVLKNPLPTNADLKNVCLINHDTGFACGSNQTILKTTDGGVTWQQKGWSAYNQMNAIAFSTRDTGFAVSWYYIMMT